MKRFVFIFAVLLLTLGLTGMAGATNGDNLIGVGPTSRAMGGVGIAAPQDAISAIFNNPAALGTINGSEFDFAGTLFIPTVTANVLSPAPPNGVGNWSGKSQDRPFAIPAIGFKAPITDTLSFGIAAFGVSGMGVDYRNIDPMGMNSKLSVMKFTPAIAYKNGAFSAGLGVDIDYQAVDFGEGLSHNYAIGARLGALYDLGMLSLGATYVTPQSVTHKRVYDFDGNGTYDDLKLQMPQQIGFGVAVKPISNFLVEADARWVDWGGAKGYKDFDWRSQWVYAIGAQYKVMPNLTLRAGYNYGRNPVKTHDGFNPAGLTSLQGIDMSTFGYEYFRIIGFPAIVEQHISFGLGYDFSPKFGVNLGYTHAINKTISETSAMSAVTLESSLKEDAFDFGLTYRF